MTEKKKNFFVANQSSVKQISEVEEKPFTSPLNICPELLVGEGGGVTPAPSPKYPVDLWIFYFKDDVTFFLILGAPSYIHPLLQTIFSN
jgi:hypothetical protein